MFCVITNLYSDAKIIHIYIHTYHIYEFIFKVCYICIYVYAHIVRARHTYQCGIYLAVKITKAD